MPGTRASPAFRIIAWLVTLFLRLMRWRIEFEGLENVPRTGGLIVTFNHHSYADFFVSGLPLYNELGRPPRFLAKQELFEQPVIGRLLASAGQVPVARDRRTGRREAFEEAVQRLRSGEVVAIAPEQTISRSFELLPFSSGTARMARDAGVPVVPSVSWGSQRFATKGRPTHWRSGRGIPILVRYGEPLRMEPAESLEAFTERLRSRMAAMLHDVQRAYPERPAPDDDWWLPARLGGSAPPHDEVVAQHREREERWRGEG